MRGTTSQKKITVWDLFVRLFHWTLVAAMGYEFLAEDGTNSHERVGYALMALVVARTFWGFYGTKHARFSNFVVPPTTLWAYLRAIIFGHPKRYIGHNPAGGAMVLCLLAGVFASGATGYAMTTDALWGQEWAEDLHEIVANMTLALIIFHVLGVALASLQHKENLVRAMITGKKSE